MSLGEKVQVTGEQLIAEGASRADIYKLTALLKEVGILSARIHLSCTTEDQEVMVFDEDLHARVGAQQGAALLGLMTLLSAVLIAREGPSH